MWFYNKQKLHKVGYFKELMATNPDISSELKPLLTICRETIVRIGRLRVRWCARCATIRCSTHVSNG